MALDKKKIKYKKTRSAMESCGTKIKSNNDKIVIGVKISASSIPLIHGKLEKKESRTMINKVIKKGDLKSEKYFTVK